MFLVIAGSSDLAACVCEDIETLYNNAVAQFNAGGGTDARLYRRILRLLNQYEIKCNEFPPLDPPPPPPPGFMGGGGGGGGGRGRGGAVGGGGPPGGGPVPFNAWMRNHSGMPCSVTWNIVPVAGNPAGFTISPTSGTISVAAFTANQGTLDPFGATIASNVPPGTTASFDITFIDGCNGLPYNDATKRFTVTATADVCITPLTPLVAISDSGPSFLTWRITNCSPNTVTKTYRFGGVGDPSSLKSLNDGTEYFIDNAFPAHKPPVPADGSGSVTLDPGEFKDVTWEIVPSQHCDPQMVGCCFVEVDNVQSCILVPSDSTGITHQTDSFFNLYGTAQGGSLTSVVTLNAQPYTVQVPTSLGDTIPVALDRLAAAMISRSRTDDPYNFQPVVDPGSFGVKAPNSAMVTVSTNDPGLVWSNYASITTSLSPLGYWRLNEVTQPPPVLVDANLGNLGPPGNGTYAGATPGVAGALVGSANTATSFNGVNDSVAVSYSPALSFGAPFTVEAWLKAASTTGTPCPLSGGTFGANHSGWLIFQNGSSGWNLQLYNGVGANTTININAGGPITPGAWYHVVGVFNGANATLYVNGVGTTAMAGSPFAPNFNGPLTIGRRSDGNFPWAGSVDEVAIYLSPLSAMQVQQHYQNGINPTPPFPYDQLVLSTNPRIYLRLDEPALPVAVNIGLFGPNVNGNYQPGSLPGKSGVPFLAMGANNFGTEFNGMSGYVDIPGAPLNLTGPVTVMAWVKADPANGIFQTIVGKGDTSYRLSMDTLGFPRFADGSTNPEVVGPTRIDDGHWHMLTGVHDNTTNSLYVDGLPAGSSPAPDPVAGNSLNLWIGGAPDYGLTRIFNGVIDEVAIFQNAFSPAQTLASFYAATPPPNITITIGRVVGNMVQVKWGRGILQSAPVVGGSYTDLPTNVTSPYTFTPATDKEFFRARQ